MIKPTDLADTFSLPDASITVNRIGCGAMQLAGPEVWEASRDGDAAIAVLCEAVDSGVNHIHTSNYYGPHITNQLIKRAIHPCRKDLVIVTQGRRSSRCGQIMDSCAFPPGADRRRS